MTKLISVEEEWLVEKLVPGGAGFARRADGSAGFVQGALPGERLRVSRLEKKSGYARASAFELVETSPERVAPPCPRASECGGCDWLHLAYPSQLQHKSALLAEALRRTGGFHELPRIEVMPSPRSSNYRVRIRLHIDERGRVGFFAAGSHRLVSVQDCLAARPELNRALAEFCELAPTFAAELAEFSEVELRVAPRPPEVLLAFSPRAGNARNSSADTPLFRALRERFAVAVLQREQSPAQRFPLSDALELELLPGAFVQVNWEVNLLLVEQIVDGARQRQAHRFLDVYAGAGNFTLPLAAQGLSGVSVEAHPLAAVGCRRTLERYGFERVTVLAEGVGKALERLVRDGARFDLVVLDPPRSGAREVLSLLTRLRPGHIAYLSCDPVTLARDLRGLVTSGYRLGSVTGFDMFPGTHHVEALAWLELER